MTGWEDRIIDKLEKVEKEEKELKIILLEVYSAFNDETAKRHKLSRKQIRALNSVLKKLTSIIDKSMGGTKE
jgi:hypothetical protein